MRKTALVTGGAGGIGEAVCKALSKEGYDIFLHYNSSEEKALTIKAEIEKEGFSAVTLFKEDLSSNEGGRLLAERVNEKGGVNVLINNAGLSLIGLFQLCSDEKINALLNVNLVNTMALTKGLIGKMISEKQGVIINISSMWGIKGASCEVHYSASKAGLIGFTKALSKEVGPSGIRVNCVAPGFIETEMNSCFTEEDAKAIIDETPLCRSGKPEDVANAVAFLVSEKASYITGQVLGVDGGI